MIHLEERLRAENKEIGAHRQKIGAPLAIGFLRLPKNPLLGVDGRPNLFMTLDHKFRLSISTALKLVGSNRRMLEIDPTTTSEFLLSIRLGETVIACGHAIWITPNAGLKS